MAFLLPRSIRAAVWQTLFLVITSHTLCASVILFPTETALTTATGAIGPLHPPFRGDSTAPLIVGPLTITADPGVPFAVANIIDLFEGSDLIVSNGPYFSNFTIDISFSTHAFGFTIGSSSSGAGVGDSMFDISLFSSALLVDSFSFPAVGNGVQFVGFQSTNNFNRVQITETVGGPDSLNFGADQDRETFGRFFLVPEPRTLSTAALGLVLTIFAGLRRRKTGSRQNAFTT